MFAAIEHRAVRPPREGMVGEEVFAARWQELMAQEPEWDDYATMLHAVLRDYTFPIGQREAEVAASVIQWLGTNAGESVVHKADSISRFLWPNRLPGEDVHSAAYVAAFTMTNRRDRCVNMGVRAVEGILARESDLGYGRYGCYGVVRLPPVSANDVEVVEHVMYWLGSTTGASFLKTCREEVTTKRRLASEARIETFTALHSAPSQSTGR